MATNEHSSPRLASLASHILRDRNSSPEARELAGSVLTQALDHAPRNALMDYAYPYNALEYGHFEYSLWDWNI
jgi:hypothetical protein